MKNEMTPSLHLEKILDPLKQVIYQQGRRLLYRCVSLYLLLALLLNVFLLQYVDRLQPFSLLMFFLIFTASLSLAAGIWLVVACKRFLEKQYAKASYRFLLLKKVGPLWLWLSHLLAKEQHSALNSAWVFHYSPQEGSVALQQAHIQQVCQKIQQLPWQQRLETWGLHEKLFKKLNRAQLLLLLCLLLQLSFFQKVREKLFFGLTNSIVQPSNEDLLADLQVHYHYPAYTKWPDRVIEGSNGDLEAPQGSQVHLQAKSLQPCQKAWAEITPLQGNTESLPWRIHQQRELSIDLTIVKPASYQIRLQNLDAQQKRESRQRRIQVIADTPPKAMIASPVADVTIRHEKSLSIVYSANDDYGIESIHLLFQYKSQLNSNDLVPQKDLRLALALPQQRFDEAPVVNKEREGRYTLYLSQLNLQAGQSVTMYLEVTDNNAIDGPQTTLSEPHLITMYSSEKLHEKIIEEESLILDTLVDNLDSSLQALAGQSLEQTLKLQQIVLQKEEELLRLLQTLLSDIQEDNLSDPKVATAFQGVQKNLQSSQQMRTEMLKNRLFQIPPLQKALNQLEKDIVYLDDLIALHRINNLQGQAQKLLQQQQQLQSLIKDLKDNKDPQAIQALQEQIASVKQQMTQLAQQMNLVRQHLPGEFRNLEAMKNMQMEDTLGDLQKHLEEQDMDAAGRELEQLANMIDNMLHEVDDMKEQFGEDRYAGIRQAMDNFGQQLQQLQQKQQNLAQQSETLLQTMQEEQLKKSGYSLKGLIQKAQQQSRQAQEDLLQLQRQHQSNHADLQEPLQPLQQKLTQIQSLLKHDNLKDAYPLIVSLNDETKMILPMLPENIQEQAATQDLHKQIQAMQKLLQPLFEADNQSVPKEIKENLQHLASQQKQQLQAMQQLEEAMQKLNEEMPLFGQESQDLLQNAQQAMAEAAQSFDDQSLQQSNLNNGRLRSQGAADALETLQQRLEEAQQKNHSEAGQQPGQKPGKSAGMPMPLDGAYKPQGGNQHHDHDHDVEIPQATQENNAQKFRQELLEAAKQKTPPRFKEAVQRYYKELIQ